MADVTFYRGTQSQYDTKLENNQISADGLYFITDNGKIYVGTTLVGSVDANLILLEMQVPGSAVEDGTEVILTDTSVNSVSDLIRMVFCVVDSVSGEAYVFKCGGIYSDGLYVYTTKLGTVYYIYLSQSGSDLVGTIHTVSYLDGDSQLYGTL